MVLKHLRQRHTAKVEFWIMLWIMVGCASATTVRYFINTEMQRDMMLRRGLNLTDTVGVMEGSSQHVQFARDIGVESEKVMEPWQRLSDPFRGYTTETELSSKIEVLASQSHGEVLWLGTSVEGRQISAVRLGPKRPSAPRVMFMGGIHGNEPVGTELVLQFGSHVINADATEIMQDVEIYIVPRVNPDGFAHMSRSNVNNVDLNRNFPDQYVGEDANDYYKKGQNEADDDDSHPSMPRQKETTAMMNFITSVRPHLVAMLHSGTTICNYPFDGNRDHKQKSYSEGPDDPLFREVCSAWASLNPEMIGNRMWGATSGAINGAKWYILYGGLQDWAYINAGVISLTMEVSRDQWPDGRSVNSRYGPNNLAGMVAFARTAMQSISGRVMVEGTALANAAIRVSLHAEDDPDDDGDHVGDIDLMEVKTDANGYYVRLLPVGRGTIVVAAPQCIGARINYVMQEGMSLRRDFNLRHLADAFAHRL